MKRKKKLSKKYYGSSHTISKDEAKFVYEDGCNKLVLGTGQDDNVRLSNEAAEYFEDKGCKVIAQPTPDAIDTFNHTKKGKIIRSGARRCTAARQTNFPPGWSGKFP